MKCLRCFEELETQDSKRYPYVCPKCGIAYGKWRVNPTAKAMDATFQYQQRKRRELSKKPLLR